MHTVYSGLLTMCAYFCLISESNTAEPTDLDSHKMQQQQVTSTKNTDF